MSNNLKKEELKNNTWVPLKYDLMAKKVFGDEKDLRPIKFLLKQILDINAEKVIILNNEIIDKPYKDKKYSVDLIVEVEGKKIGVEVNTNVTPYVIDRNVFFMTRIMSRDLKPSEEYSELNSHIQINFDIKGKHKKPIMEYELMDKVTHEVLTDKMKIYRIDVEYFYRICYNKNASIKEKFIGLFNEEDKEKAKELIKGDEDMKSIYDKIDDLSDNIVGVYDRESRKRAEFNYELKEARENGLKEGKRTMVLNMLHESIDINTISKVSGLSIEEIESIKNNKL